MDWTFSDKGVDLNFVSPVGESAITFAAFNERCGCEVLEVLLADHRVIRTRPPDEAGVEAERLRRAQATYDLALRNVKQRRNSRFKGIIRAMGVFRRLRLRAAQTAQLLKSAMSRMSPEVQNQVIMAVLLVSRLRLASVAGMNPFMLSQVSFFLIIHFSFL